MNLQEFVPTEPPLLRQKNNCQTCLPHQAQKSEKQHDRQTLKFNVMKTLKIVMLMIAFSLFMTSCTDLINSDDQMIMDSIENTNTNAAYDTGDETVILMQVVVIRERMETDKSIKQS